MVVLLTPFFLLPTPTHASVLIQRPLYVGLTQGLVGSWTFDGADMNATQALDVSGQGNHGTLTNGPTRTIGKIGQALDFDGGDDDIRAPDVDILDITGDMAISLWVKLDTTGGSEYLVTKESGSPENTPYNLYINDSGTPYYAWYHHTLDGDYSSALTFTNYTVPTGVWEHVVAVRDVTAKDVTLYVNGTARQTLTYSADDPAASNKAVFIGGDSLQRAGRYIDGFIDDVRIYNRALSAQEVKRLYKIGGTFTINKAPSTGSLTDGLVSHWSFDGTTVSGTDPLKVNDLSGNGNQGSAAGSNIPKRAIGKIGQALDFDGSNDYIDVLGVTPASSQGTISFWFNSHNDLTAAGGNPVFRLRDNASGDQIDLFPFDGTFYIGWQDTSDERLTWTIADIATDTWYLGTFTWVEGGDQIFYIDTVEKIRGSLTTAGTWDTAAATHARWAADQAASSFFDGLLDDVRIYDRALSAQEIKRLYNLGR